MAGVDMKGNEVMLSGPVRALVRELRKGAVALELKDDWSGFKAGPPRAIREAGVDRDLREHRDQLTAWLIANHCLNLEPDRDVWIEIVQDAQHAMPDLMDKLCRRTEQLHEAVTKRDPDAARLAGRRFSVIWNAMTLNYENLRRSANV